MTLGEFGRATHGTGGVGEATHDTEMSGGDTWHWESWGVGRHMALGELGG